MTASAAARLLDWDAAARVGSRLAGQGPPIGRAERAALTEDFVEILAEADAAVTAFTGIPLGGSPSMPWVMSRSEWIVQNLRGFERLLAPVAERVVGRMPAATALVRRRMLALQVGAILGYLGRKVLGQYDLFVPADDRDQLYFVGPNVVEIERQLRFRPRDFRMWIALHEVSHRVQFEGVPWLRGYLSDLIDAYLGSLELDARKLVASLRRAVEEARRSNRWREMGVLFLLMTPEQRETFRRMQALMSLLEGHANFVMDRVSEGRVQGSDRMRRMLHQRRHRQGWNRMVQRAVGLDVKVRQYDLGERFVSEVVGRAGTEAFARVWTGPDHLPNLQEIGRPEMWIDRVGS